MNSRNLLQDEKAVSISIGFILMFSVTMLVFTSTVLSFYSLTLSTEKSAMQVSFRMIGSELAARITTVDTLVNITDSYGGTVNSLEYEMSVPDSIAGKTYTANITSPVYEIVMEADNVARIVVPFTMSTGISQRKIYSGTENFRLIYNRTTSTVGIEEE